MALNCCVRDCGALDGPETAGVTAPGGYGIAGDPLPLKAVGISAGFAGEANELPGPSSVLKSCVRPPPPDPDAGGGGGAGELKEGDDPKLDPSGICGLPSPGGIPSGLNEPGVVLPDATGGK